MMLPYWVEYLLTIPRKNSSRIGTLINQVGVEYYFPIVPPATEVYFHTIAKGAYAAIFFNMIFGDLVPGAFQVTYEVRGRTAFSGRIQGHLLGQGVHYFFVQAPEDIVRVYVSNLSPVNQMFEMISQYLRIETELDYFEVLEALRKIGMLPTQGVLE